MKIHPLHSASGNTEIPKTRQTGISGLNRERSGFVRMREGIFRITFKIYNLSVFDRMGGDLGGHLQL